ncbi:hypothetical protein DFAR_2460004 [Desulfarculales bacterium]
MNRLDESQSRPPDQKDASISDDVRRKAKFEVYGEEMIEKEVKPSGNSGRVYLPRSGLARTSRSSVLIKNSLPRKNAVMLHHLATQNMDQVIAIH